MSQKNKLEVKRARKYLREQAETALEMQSTRRALSHIPREVALRVLLEPKQKLSSKKRKRMARALASQVLIPAPHEPRDPAVKVTLKLRSLSLVGVIRVMKKSARRAATHKYLLEKVEPTSRFRAPLEASQNHLLGVLKQATAEYQVRTATT